MALPSQIAARRQVALNAMYASLSRLTGQLAIEGPQEMPGGVRDPSLRETVRIECIAEVLSRIERAMPKPPAFHTPQQKAKAK